MMKIKKLHGLSLCLTLMCVGNLFASNVQEIITAIKKSKTVDISILKKVEQLSAKEQQALIAGFNNCKAVDEQIRMLPLFSKLPFDKFKPLAEEYIINKKDCPDELYFAIWKELGSLLIASDKGIKSEPYRFMKELQKKFMGKKHRTLSQMRHFGSIQGFLDDTYIEYEKEAEHNQDRKEYLQAQMEAYIGYDYKKLFVLDHFQEIDLNQPVQVITRRVSDATPFCPNRKYMVMLTELLSHENAGVRMGAVKKLQEITGKKFNYNPANSPEQEKEKIAIWKKFIEEFKFPK